VVSNVSKKLNIDKSELLSRDQSNLAVNMATMETHVIKETKEWLNDNGFNMDSLKGKRQDCIRSKTTLFIKNISPNASKESLEELLSRFGLLSRLLLAPNNGLAVAEFIDSNHAANCMKHLAYYELDGLPLYLEFAPDGLIPNQISLAKEKSMNKEGNSLNLVENQGKIVFISNLSFKTNEIELKEFLIKKWGQTKKCKDYNT